MSIKERTVQTGKINDAIYRSGLKQQHIVMVLEAKTGIRIDEPGFTRCKYGKRTFEPELAKPLADLLTNEDQVVTVEDIYDWFGIATADV